MCSPIPLPNSRDVEPPFFFPCPSRPHTSALCRVICIKTGRFGELLQYKSSGVQQRHGGLRERTRVERREQFRQGEPVGKMCMIRIIHRTEWRIEMGDRAPAYHGPAFNSDARCPSPSTPPPTSDVPVPVPVLNAGSSLPSTPPPAVDSSVPIRGLPASFSSAHQQKLTPQPQPRLNRHNSTS